MNQSTAKLIRRYGYILLRMRPADYQRAGRPARRAAMRAYAGVSHTDKAVVREALESEQFSAFMRDQPAKAKAAEQPVFAPDDMMEVPW